MKSAFAFGLCVAWAASAGTSLGGPRTSCVTAEGADTKCLGVFGDEKSPSAAFTVRNTSEGPIRITKIVKTCGCANATADREVIAAGAAATVRVTIAPYTLEGAFSKSVFVLTEPEGAPLRLTVTGDSLPLFSVKPSRRLDAGRLSGGGKWEGAFELCAASPAVLGELAVTSDCPAAVSAEERSAEAGARPGWRIPVRLSLPEHGAFRCRIAIPVLLPTNRPPLELEVAGWAGTSLFAVPASVSVPPSEKPVAHTVRLRLSGRRPRAIIPGQLSVTPSTEGLEICPKTKPDGELQVTLSTSPALFKRLAKDGPLELTFSVPGAAPARIILRAAVTDADKEQ